MAYYKIALSTDGGTADADFTTQLTPNGLWTPSQTSWAWTIPASLSTAQGRIRVRAMDGSGNLLAQAFSAANFTISGPLPTITVTLPAGGENWTAGTAHSVTWTVSGSTASVAYYKIALSTDGGTADADFTTQLTPNGLWTPSQTSWAWTIPASLSTAQGRIRVRAMDGSGNLLAQAFSAANFAISTLAPVAAPTFSPPPGTYTSAQSVKISTTTGGATVRYTLDGSQPISSSSHYVGPVSITTTTTLNARAFKTGMADSKVTSGTYTINLPQVAAPTFNPRPGSYNSVQNVTISTTTSGATIRYTINGTDPTNSSSPYTGPLKISTTTTLRAAAFKTAMTESLLTSGTYTIQLPSIVLLLHGMNSDPTTWNDFIDDNNYFPSYVPILNVPTAPIIFGGVVLSASGANPTPDKNGVRYYRVEFGAYDVKYGTTGSKASTRTGTTQAILLPFLEHIV